MKFHLVFAAALAGCAPALAQSTRMLMPEGSRDIYLSLGAVYGPSAEGSAQRRLFAGPLISAQWSNGVFIDMNTVGVHLSDDSNLEYGFTLTPALSRTSVRTDSGRQSTTRFTPEAGAFLNYEFAYGMGLTSNLRYGGSSDRRGLRMKLGAHLLLPLAAHHSLGLETSIGLANRSALQADYGVAADQAGPQRAVHTVDGGVRDSTLGAGWRWQVSNKYSLKSSLEWRRLHGSAASSPRIEQASAFSLATVLTYRY